MSTEHPNPFGTLETLRTAGGELEIYSLPRLAAQGIGHLDRLPISIKVLLEAALRHHDGYVVTDDDIQRIASWNASDPGPSEVPFMPARVVLQDFTGVPAVVDLAALRDACKELGADPRRINPLVPCDLVIDHSIQVDHFGSADSLRLNSQREFERNRERYTFLKWGQQAFGNFRVVPPSTGIIHQVNLEYLASVVMEQGGVAFPDTLVGTDSHTVMINGLGVVGWGVGGIEAEAVMLGQPIYMLLPRVVGFRLTGELPPGATATDLVLTVVQMLREVGVVGQFVEFFGPGLGRLSLTDRATIANMGPEYGATIGFFPVDDKTLDYMRMTGRDAAVVDRAERYCKAQGLWGGDAMDVQYTRTIELDLSTVVPSLAGPKRPQDRIALSRMREQWGKDLVGVFGKQARGAGGTTSSAAAEPSAARASAPVAVSDAAPASVHVELDGERFEIGHGSVVIAAITSCTNTSNPTVMLGAGLLARNAVARGLRVKPWVKTSLAPGSRVVSDYLESAGVLDDLEALRFYLVGYGCTTCIGNSGPLPEPVAKAIRDNDLVAASVLSGNRNFEGRISPDVKANYLASPPLVVAYALAGTVDIDLTRDPLGNGSDGRPVYLRDIWPDQDELAAMVQTHVRADQFAKRYADVFAGDAEWKAVEITGGDIYDWDGDSTYIRRPPFFEGMSKEVKPIRAISGARCLAMLGHSVTTDHISPAGVIKTASPAGSYLTGNGVQPFDFNSYGSRRGNHEVMMRGTFANVRLRNLLAPGTEGGVTIHLPTGEQMSIYDAAMRYRETRTPLVVLAGKEYGTGSSRDWAAKGTFLLGVRAVIAQSYERIHRSNLVGMGVLPLQFAEGETRESLGLTGEETYEIRVDDALKPGQPVTVSATDRDGKAKQFTTLCRLDTPVEVEYYRNGGILHTVLRKLASS